MSTQLVAVSDCVAALCSVYHEGATILHRLKIKRKGLDISAQELELSITRGESVVRDHYKRTQEHLGESFKDGDRMP